MRLTLSAARLVAIPTSLVLLCGCAIQRPPPTPPAWPAETWDEPAQWDLSKDGGSTAEFTPTPTPSGNGLRLQYVLNTGGGWIQLKKKIASRPDTNAPVTFMARAEGTGDLEVKFVDADGSTFGLKVPLQGQFTNWTRVTMYFRDLDYWWGGDENFGGLAEYHFAVSGTGSGVFQFAEIGVGSSNLPSSFERDPKHPGVSTAGIRFQVRSRPMLDPDADLPGLGFRQRRAAELTPEDPLVLEGLKQIQDVSSPERQLLPSMENNEAQTFNNMLVAMAFILKGERERAERILDFYARATVRDNADPTLQNFFLKGEARGFFQFVTLHPESNVPAYHNPNVSDRWMGDMAWMLFAYTYYEKQYGPDRYRELTGLLKDLLVSWYTDAADVPGGGYVRHGWRKGDTRLHEPFGHVEGNLDAYAVFTLCGETNLAAKVRKWLDATARGKDQPLDQYTWRVLAYDGKMGELLDIPDHDLRYRKTVTVGGRPVIGVYHSANTDVNNIWLDGVGHMACAYFAAGNRERGNFYANQLDALLIDCDIHGVHTRGLPYVLSREGGFDWVDVKKGFISVDAWYIFAKNRFNPMTLKQAP